MQKELSLLASIGESAELWMQLWRGLECIIIYSTFIVGMEDSM